MSSELTPAHGGSQWYQWDYGQRITILDDEIDQVHIYNPDREEATVIDVVDGVAEIPDRYLQEAGQLKVYAFTTAEGRTTGVDTWKILGRQKPEDYPYVPDEDISAGIAIGSPLTARTAAEMKNKSRVYVYTGAESGYTNGNWYYWDGSAWISGGVYNAVSVDTDTTLAVSGKPADAAAVGDAISDLESAMPSTAEIEEIRAVGAQVLESIPADYTELSEDVGNLKSEYSYETKLPLTFTTGKYIKFEDGEVGTPSNPTYWAACIDYINISGISLLYMYLVATDIVAAIAVYDKDKQFISAARQGSNTTYQRFEVPENAVYARFSTRAASLDTSYVIARTMKPIINLQALIEDGKNEDNAISDRISEEVSRLNAESMALSKSTPIIEWIENAYIKTNSSVGAVVDTTEISLSGYRCAKVDCNPGDFFTLNVAGASTPRAWAFLDAENKLIIVSPSMLTCTDTVLVAPDGSQKLILNDKPNNGVFSSVSFKGIPPYLVFSSGFFKGFALPKNPYINIPWAVVKDLTSVSHAHCTTQEQFDTLKSKYDHIAISNYYPSMPYYPLSEHFEGVQDVLASPNAEHHGFDGENSKLHMNSIGSIHTSNERYSGTARDMIKMSLDSLLMEHGGGVTINHPAWTGMTKATAQELIATKGIIALEIWNASSEVDTETGFSIDFWDSILSDGVQIFGVAVPDHEAQYRPQENRQPFGYNHMLVYHETEEEILSAYRQGRFYTTLYNDGLTLKNLALSSGAVSIEVSETSTFLFKTATRSVAVDTASTTASLTAAADDVYVRVEATRGNNKLFTNAIFL